MSCAAIIAEYNPFHNGHAYQLNEALRLTGADSVLAIISGSFLQRGEPAMWDKYTRAEMCLKGGADLVLELPFVYAAGSARDFAYGAVNILNSLGCVDFLCFGAEDAGSDLFYSLSDIITDEPEAYRSLLKKGLSEGYSYPSARARALTEYTGDPNLSDVLKKPNNILALEYICALKEAKSRINPVIIKRKSSDYHNTSLNEGFASAAAIREYILSDKEAGANRLKEYVPSYVYDILCDRSNTSSPIYAELLTPHLQTARLFIDKKNSNLPCDMSRELYNKLKQIPICSSFEETVIAAKCRNYTASRIRRALIHLILNYGESERGFFRESPALYAGMLGLKKQNNGLLKLIKEKSQIPLIAKKADFSSLLDEYPDINKELAGLMWRYDTDATFLYNCLVYNRYGRILPNDYTAVIPVI